MERREFLRKSALAGTGLILASQTRSALGDTVSTDGAAVASCLWGVHAEPRWGQIDAEAIQWLEQQVGRRFAVDRHYRHWDIPLPTPYDEWTSEQGRIPYISWGAERSTGGAISWGAIARGHHDAWIRQQALSLKHWGGRIFLTFNHEPELCRANGTRTEFKAAFEHIRWQFHTIGVPDVTWVATLMASTFAAGNGWRWLPSSNSYDLVGVDGYNRSPCMGGSWTPFKEVFTPARRGALMRGKGLLIGEFGCVEQTSCGNTAGSPMAKAQWFRDALTTLESWPEVKAAVYSHTQAWENGKLLRWWVDTSTNSIDAYRQVGLSTYLN